MPANRPKLTVRAALVLSLAAASCSSTNTALLTVTADGPVDQFFLYVRDDDATPRKILVSSGWTDATKMGAVKFGSESHTIGVSLPRKGRYTIVLLGMKGTVPCLPGVGAHDMAVPGDGGFPDGGAMEDFGTGTQFFWATQGTFQGNEELPAHLYEVKHAAGANEDQDCDAFPDVNTWLTRAQPNPTIATTLLDCNDKDPAINPLAVPRCGQTTDVDCSGMIPPACSDSDGDGDPDCADGQDPTTCDCAKDDPKRHHPNTKDPFPQSPNCCGYSLGKTGDDRLKSFNDSPLCHPGTCGGSVAYDCSAPIACKADQDCDTFLATASQPQGCSAPANNPPGDDCNDCDPKVHPGAVEICGDAIDNNCNGAVDEGCVLCDLDGDGYQRTDVAAGCPDNSYPKDKALDCNDEDRGVFPGALKAPVPMPGLKNAGLKDLCDPTDPTALAACGIRRYCYVARQAAADCKDSAVVGLAGCPSAKCDADGDSFIDAAQAATCDPMGKFAGSYDCNDKDPTVFPGAPDKCGDGVAQNCVKDLDCGKIVDGDKDGYSPDYDTLDTSAAVHPFAVEVCNGQDDNGDGLIDETNPDVSGATMAGAKCNTSGIGECAPKVGHCVCSGFFQDATSVYVTSDGARARCTADDATGDAARKTLTLPRCYFAVQPKAETCDGLDTSCTGFQDLQPLDHKTKETTTGQDTLMKMYSLTDCAGPTPGMICCGPTPACPEPEKALACRNSAADTCNCGNCGLICSRQNGSATCNAGSCVIACAAGFANCDNVVGNAGVGDNGCEVNTLTDINNCGTGGGSDSKAPGCGVKCSPANIATKCTAGICNGACAAGFADCNSDKQLDGCEVNTHDVLNCGVGGATGKDEGGGKGLQGAGCGCKCTVQNGVPACAAGACTIQCSAGFANCDGIVGDSCTGNDANGCEINITNDVKNCGACNKACSGANVGAARCVGSNCTADCSNGFADCNVDKQKDGCEDNVAIDPDNCGLGGATGPMNSQGQQGAGCGVKCSANHMALRTCGAGVCNGTCAALFADCNVDKLADGCEKDTSSDPNNCGPGGAVNNGQGLAAGCGAKCSNNNIAVPTCAAGKCSGTCAGGSADCNMDKLADGCEQNVATDPNNCGPGGAVNNGQGAPAGCGVICSNAGMATRTCLGGACNGDCNNGVADCNNNKQTDGCEASTFSVLNCGPGGTTNAGHGAAAGCGCACSTQNGTPSCGSGACTIACNPNFGNCDNLVGNSCLGNQANGCETDLRVTVAHCGACGQACSSSHITAACSGGNCTGVCANNFVDCDGDKRTNGCECDTIANICSMGKCLKKDGQMCGGNSECNSGSCCTNVCATINGSDTNNCGACGNKCDVNLTDRCTAGSCKCGAGAACVAGQRCNGGGMCVCDATSCPGGCCNGNTCVLFGAQTAGQCGTNGANCTACGLNADTCTNGGCKCGAGAVCGAGQACSGGNCVCNAASCPNGCCNGTTCVAYGSQSVNSCGTGGAACGLCGVGANNCSSGVCTCGGGAACGAGLQCQGGACNCTAASCALGCCQGNACQAGNSAGACGTGGGACSVCGTGTAGNACVNNVCACAVPADCANNVNGKVCIASLGGGKVCGCVNGGDCGSLQKGNACVGTNGAGDKICGCAAAVDCDINKACDLGTSVCGTACSVANTCNTGCCSAGSCVAGSANSACGNDGSACVACGPTKPGNVCVMKACGCNGNPDCAANNNGLVCTNNLCGP